MGPRVGLEEEGIKTSRSAISLFLSRYSKTGDIGDAPRSGRNAKLAPEAIAFIDEKMHENDELTSRELKEKLENECDFQISEATIRRARRKLGWEVVHIYGAIEHTFFGTSSAHLRKSSEFIVSSSGLPFERCDFYHLLSNVNYKLFNNN